MLQCYHGRLEAARTNTRSSDVASPSIWISSSVFILRLPSCSLLDTDIRFLLSWFPFPDHVKVIHSGTFWVLNQQERCLQLIRGTAHPELVPLWPITDSSSSRKMVDGAWYLASWNRTYKSKKAPKTFTVGVKDLVILRFITCISINKRKR